MEKRAKTFMQWINESAEDSPWFTEISRLLVEMLEKHFIEERSTHDSISLDEETGSIIIFNWIDLEEVFGEQSEYDVTAIQSFTLTPVFNVPQEVSGFIQRAARNQPEKFLDEITGFSVGIHTRLESEDLPELDYSEQEKDSIEFSEEVSGWDEEFSKELYLVLSDYIDSYGNMEELSGILQAHIDDYEGRHSDNEEDEDEDEDFEEEFW